MSKSTTDNEGHTLVVVSNDEPADRVSYSIQVAGKAILWLDLFWAVAWFVVALVMGFWTTPLPPTLIPGLPTSEYDQTLEYRASHRALAFHFLLPSIYFSLATGHSHEPLIVWYMLPIGAVVFTDVYANVENWVHLSRDTIPAFFILEVVMATSALVISVGAFAWYQAAYWHFRLTGRRFDHAIPKPALQSAPAQSSHAESRFLQTQDDSQIDLLRKAQIRLPYFGQALGTQMRLRLPPSGRTK
jgi:hypothetical protein